MTAGEVLGRPLALGRRTLPNRLVAAPMERNYCDAEGRMTPGYADYLVERARAGVGLVFTEATFVRQDGKGRTHQLGAHDDACIPPLTELADRVHALGSLLGCELNHGGRTVNSAVSGRPVVAPSAVPCEVSGGEVPRVLTTAEVDELVAAFADAAARCVAAGVDVLSLHAGHGYLVHQFLSPLYNDRDDEYAAPTLFLDRVVAAVRERCPEVVLGIRFSAVEGSPGGLDADATFALVSSLRLDQLDFLDISAGSYEAGEWIVQSGEWPQGYLGPIAARYRSLGLPLGLAGRISSPETAAALVADGTTDFVSLGRALHADPAFATACLLGTSYRPCIACNVCIDNLGSGPVGCSVNPAAGPVPLLPVTTVPAGTTVQVLGAGPAGLTAARELALAGAEVTVVEPGTFGGDLALAAGMTSTPDFARFLDWSRAELDRLQVSVQAAAPVGADVVVDATGGTPVLPGVPGAGSGRVHAVRDWLAAGAPDPASCVVWGADAAGMSVADTLAGRGVQVLLVGTQSQVAPDAGRRAKILAVPRLTTSPGVTVLLATEVVAVEETRLLVRDADGERWVDATGPVLVSQGVHRAPLPGPASGPAAGPSTIRHAVAEGRRVAAEVAAQVVRIRV